MLKSKNMLSKFISRFHFIKIIILLVLFCTFRSEAQNPWKKLASLPDNIDYKAVTLNGKLYAISSSGEGTNVPGSVYVYDFATDSWTKKKQMKKTRITQTFSVAALNNKIYVMSGVGSMNSSGYNCSRSVEIYNPVNNTWTTADSLFIGRAYVETAEAGGKLYTLGGHRYSNNFMYNVRLIEQYDPTTKHWTEVGLIPKDTYTNRMVKLNDTLYIFCFTDLNYKFIPAENKVEVFNSGKNKQIGDCPVVAFNRNIFVIIDSVYKYDLDKQSWKTLSRKPYDNWMVAGTELNGKIYLIGGYKGEFMQGSWETDFYEYDPSLDPLLTSIENNQSGDIASMDFKLNQNYPNPFNPETVISYHLAIAGQVELKVFDLLGREIVTLVNEEQNSGTHEVIFNAKELSSGVYLYRIKAGTFVKTNRMTLMK